MRCMSKKRICLILAFLMLFTGMCLENRRAHSLFVSPVIPKTDSSVYADALLRAESDVCTAEMLGVRNYSYIWETAGKSALRYKDMKVSLYALCVWSCLQAFFCFFVAAYAVYSSASDDVSEVVQYIHNADGKKRIS